MILRASLPGPHAPHSPAGPWVRVLALQGFSLSLSLFSCDVGTETAALCCLSGLLWAFSETEPLVQVWRSGLSIVYLSSIHYQLFTQHKKTSLHTHTLISTLAHLLLYRDTQVAIH